MTSPAGDQIVVGSVAVEVTASARRFARSLRREIETAFAGAGKSLQKALDKEPGDRGVKLKVNADDRSAAVAGAKASQAAQKAAPPVKLKTDVDRKSLGRVLSILGKSLAGITAGAVGLAAVGALGQGVSALLGGAAALLPVVVQLASVLATASGALAAYPGLLAIVGSAFAAFKIGVSGVGEALKAVGKDAATFEAAIEKLAPSAQRFARTIRDLKPAFDELRLDVQQRLFRGLGAAVERLAKVQLPVLREGLGDVAGSLNGVMRSGLNQLARQSSQIRLAEIFSAARDTITQLTRAVGPLLGALLDVSAVGAQVIAEVAGPVGEALEGFAGRISQMAASGELRQLILDGLDAVQLLASALGDVLGMVRGILGAAGGFAGGGLFAFLDNLNQLVNSVAGQEALTTLFTELGRIGTALMPVLLALGQGLGVVAGAIGDIAIAAGPVLSQFVGSLATALASLAPGFIALGPSVVALGQALIPLGTILSDLVVGIAPGVEAFLLALGEGLAFLAPVAPIVGKALGDLLTALAPLLPILGAGLANALAELAIIVGAIANGPLMVLISVFSDLATEWATRLLPVLLQLATDLFPVFADAGIRLLEAFQPLVPVIATLATVLAGRLAEAMPQLVDAFSQLVLALADVSVEVIDSLVAAFIALAPELPRIADAAVQLALALADLVVSIVPLIPYINDLLLLVLQMATPSALAGLTTLIQILAVSMQVLSAVLPAVVAPLAGIVSLIRSVDWGAIGSAIGGAFTAAWNAVSGFFVNVFSFFAALPGQILGFITALPGQVAAVFSDLFHRVLYAVGFGIGSVLRFFLELPGRVIGFIQALPGRLRAPFTNALNQARTAVATGISAVVSFFTNLPGRAASAVSGLWSRISGAFASAVSNARSAAGRLVTGFISQVQNLPSRAATVAGQVRTRLVSAFSGAVHWLYDAGVNILLGLANGITGAIGTAVDAAVGAAQSVVQGVRDGLGIGSPSKVFRDQVGRWIPEGIAEGVRRNSGAPRRAVDDLTSRFANRLNLATTVDATLAASDTGALPPARGADDPDLARAVGREFARALEGVRIVVDDRGRGRIEALQADRYERGG